MVRIRIDRVDAALTRRGWPRKRLIAEMDVAENTVSNMFAGRAIGDATQRALYDALGGEVPVEELFEVVVDAPDTTADAPNATPERVA